MLPAAVESKECCMAERASVGGQESESSHLMWVQVAEESLNVGAEARRSSVQARDCAKEKLSSIGCWSPAGRHSTDFKEEVV